MLRERAEWVVNQIVDGNKRVLIGVLVGTLFTVSLLPPAINKTLAIVDDAVYTKAEREEAEKKIQEAIEVQREEARKQLIQENLAALRAKEAQEAAEQKAKSKAMYQAKLAKCEGYKWDRKDSFSQWCAKEQRLANGRRYQRNQESFNRAVDSLRVITGEY